MYDQNYNHKLIMSLIYAPKKFSLILQIPMTLFLYILQFSINFRHLVINPEMLHLLWNNNFTVLSFTGMTGRLQLFQAAGYCLVRACCHKMGLHWRLNTPIVQCSPKLQTH